MVGNALQRMGHGDDRPAPGEGVAPKVAYWNQSLGPEWGRGEADPGGRRGHGSPVGW